jgi:hypothetical protein
MGVHHSKYVLNLNGHSHDYERTTPQRGVTHVTVGIGGSTLETASGTCAWSGGCPAPAWCAYRAFHHGALRLVFDAASIRGDVLCGPAATKDDIACSSGSVFDSFTITGQGVADAPPDPPSGAPGLALGGIRPDPVEEDAPFTLDYSVEDASTARLDLLDLAGRTVQRIELMRSRPGRRETLVASPQGLRPGIYWLRLRQSGREVRKSVVLLP